MSLWRHEWRLLLRQRVAMLALALMALLASASVWAGLAEVNRQQAAIERIQPVQAADEAAIARWVSVEGDAGNAAYYSFHATWDAPSSLAFAALGQRDVAPYVLRVRALGLEGQLQESENYNAELALPGRFDWAFVLTYLAPLLLIALLHDLRSGEREAGRQAMLAAMARRPRLLWTRRVVLRAGLLYGALVVPLLIGAVIAGTGPIPIILTLGLALGYFLFWVALCLWLGRASRASVTNAATVAASWLVLTLILPALALVVVNNSIPVRQGVELTLAQRENVHAGWDRPKNATMQAFFREYPDWQNTPPIEGGFHWKWYYAFQHLGDVSVRDDVAAYRSGLEARTSWTNRLGVVLPAVGVQAAIHRLADTDLTAQLAYQDRIRAFHERLRRFYYPYVFNETPFREADFAAAPRWPEAVR
jgi:ABC-2 type transport system permease protein